MSSYQTQTVSQLTLLKVPSNTTKCLVYSHLNSSLQMYELTIDDQTSVENIIHQTLSLINQKIKPQGVEIASSQCELYASKKSGRKINDLPSFSSQQKISKTGLKRFYLEYRQAAQKKRTLKGTLSTKSISSEINIAKKQVREKKANNQITCFCFP